MLAAALLWSTTGTASAFRPDGASALSVAAARIVLGGALLAAWAAYRGDLGPVLRAAPHRRLVAVGAVAVAVYQLAFFTAVASTGVAVGTVVGIVTATAKFKQLDPSAEDGTQVAAGFQQVAGTGMTQHVGVNVAARAVGGGPLTQTQLHGAGRQASAVHADE